MEKIYSEEQTVELIKARKETVQFLLNFSKSFKVIDCQGTKFDVVLN